MVRRAKRERFSNFLHFILYYNPLQFARAEQTENPYNFVNIWKEVK